MFRPRLSFWSGGLLKETSVHPKLMSMTLRLAHYIILTFVLSTPSIGSAQALRRPPTAHDMQAQLGKLVIDTSSVMVAEGPEMVAFFAPADLHGIRNAAALEAGRFIGVLQVKAATAGGHLPPGMYELFAARVGPGWHVYAHAGGRVVAEATEVALVPVEDNPAAGMVSFAATPAGRLQWKLPLPRCYPADIRSIILKHDGRSLRLSTPLELVVGQSARLGAAIINDCGASITNLPFNWAINDNTIAQVDPAAGVLIARGPGRAVLTVSAPDSPVRATAIVNVWPALSSYDRVQLSSFEPDETVGMKPVPRALRFTF
jgi:hypothetical protein